MPIMVSAPKDKEFTPAPEGLHRGVCVDVLEPWEEERPQEYGGGIVTKTRLVWEIDALMGDSRPFTVSQFYTLSLHEKAKLRAHLEAWRGREFTEAELNGFDLENVIGIPCQLQVIHKKSRDGSKTYANVATVVPMAKGSEPLSPSGDYVRVKDRKEESEEQTFTPLDDDSTPF